MRSRARYEWRLAEKLEKENMKTAIKSSNPLRHQEELPDISVFDSVPAHVELVQGDHILGEIVPDAVVDPELPVDGLRGGQQVGDLDIELLAPLFADEVDLLVPGLAHGDGVAPAQQLQIDDVLQDQVEKIVESCIIWSI